MHLHSTASDGADDPAGVVAHACEAGLAAIALTDHDTTAGLAEAAAAAREAGIEFLPGVEISALYGHHSVHILGLGIDPASDALQEVLQRLSEGRGRRAEAMVDKLREKGLPIDMEAVQAIAGDAAPGRVHLARVLQQAGAVATVQDAFDRWLKAGRSCFVPIPKVSCERAIEAIHAARGLAFIAHPGLGATTRKLLPYLLQLPFNGVEVHHSRHNPSDTAEFAALAKEHNLLMTGGSDCHGAANGPRIMGRVLVPYAVYERIRQALA